MNKVENIEQHWRLLVMMLKLIAADKKITQQVIASKTGLDQAAISRALSGRICPSLRVFILIARAVGVNFFVEDQDSDTDLSLIMERAMTQLGRRPDKLPSN